MQIRYAVTREVQAPNRGHWPDAGIDFYVPAMTAEFLDDLMNINGSSNGIEITSVTQENSFTIAPNNNATIPSGIKIEIPPGYMGLFLNKSGIASKKNLIMGAQVIDPYYSGEVHLDLHNISNFPVKIREGDKITQMALVPISHCQLAETDEEDLYSIYTSEEFRNERGFGSTG